MAGTLNLFAFVDEIDNSDDEHDYFIVDARSLLGQIEERQVANISASENQVLEVHNIFFNVTITKSDLKLRRFSVLLFLAFNQLYNCFKKSKQLSSK